MFQLCCISMWRGIDKGLAAEQVYSFPKVFERGSLFLPVREAQLVLLGKCLELLWETICLFYLILFYWCSSHAHLCSFPCSFGFEHCWHSPHPALISCNIVFRDAWGCFRVYTIKEMWSNVGDQITICDHLTRSSTMHFNTRLKQSYTCPQSCPPWGNLSMHSCT